jgi:acylphosphatase
MANVRNHVIIYGRVQGVFFRSTLQEQAYALGITGWVRNNYDGSVEAVFEGEKEKVDRITRWSHKGPRGAHVTDVQVVSEEYTGSYSSFSIKYNW